MGKLTKCKSCEREIAKSASKCPGCGARQGARIGLWIVGGLVLLLALGAVAASDKEKQAKADVANGVGAIDVTAEQLYDDYETNEVSADAKYRDKVLRVTGRVDRIGKDFTDDAYVVLSARNELIGVRAEFATDSALGALKPGQGITIRCRGKAKIMGPSLKDCVLE